MTTKHWSGYLLAAALVVASGCKDEPKKPSGDGAKPAAGDAKPAEEAKPVTPEAGGAPEEKPAAADGASSKSPKSNLGDGGDVATGEPDFPDVTDEK